ncbi:MAG: hypothetical protein K2O54_02290, partial [Prevotella sp.]|nr:hypothetical protein [Prevotella sp.]
TTCSYPDLPNAPMTALPWRMFTLTDPRCPWENCHSSSNRVSCLCCACPVTVQSIANVSSLIFIFCF